MHNATMQCTVEGKETKRENFCFLKLLFIGVYLLYNAVLVFTVQQSGRQWRTEEPGVLQSNGSQRVGQDLATEQQQFQTQLLSLEVIEWDSKFQPSNLLVFLVPSPILGPFRCPIPHHPTSRNSGVTKREPVQQKSLFLKKFQGLQELSEGIRDKD